MNFGHVFQHLLQGRMIKRSSWTTRKIKVSGGYAINERNISGNVLKHLLVTSGNSRTLGYGYEDWEPYVISNQDLFADDWEYILNSENQEINEPNPIQIQENKKVFYLVKPKKIKIKTDNETLPESMTDPRNNYDNSYINFLQELHEERHRNRQERQQQQRQQQLQQELDRQREFLLRLRHD